MKRGMKQSLQKESSQPEPSQDVEPKNLEDGRS